MQERVTGIEPTLTGKPLDDAILKFKDHPEARLLLTPLQGKQKQDGASGLSTPKRKVGDQPDEHDTEIKMLRAQVENQGGRIKNLTNKQGSWT